ncbi:uncharacterized protein [Elaeis guineensis]|uniref:uncharacterized protein n=1 Tax=Elaeis guineensis var. tenera TaxID=51953 RepID=UPI003C6D9A4E
MEEGNSNSNNNPIAQQHQQLLQQQLFLMQQYQQHHQHQLQQQQQQQQQQMPQSHPIQAQQQPSSTSQQPPLSLLQQQQQAISRFPSNIDAHLRAPGLRSLQFRPPTINSLSHPQQPQPQPQPQPPPPPPQQQQQQQAQQHHQQPASLISNLHHAQQPQSQQQQQQQPPPPPQQARAGIGMGMGMGIAGRTPAASPVEVEMAQQDAMKVCNPDIKRPFASIEDAVLRLLPYHVVSDYEAEEDDRILDSDTTGQIPSRLQQWDHNILSKIAEFTSTFEKQVLAFNIMSRKRALGEFRSEERLMIEQALLQEEKQALLEIRAEIESREKAGREAAEAKMRMAMAQAEHARAEAQAHADMIARAPMKASAAASQGDEGSGHDMGQEPGGNMEEIHGWGNAQRDDEDPSEDFLNDENEPEDGETGMQNEWREVGELDLNTR